MISLVLFTVGYTLEVTVGDACACIAQGCQFHEQVALLCFAGDRARQFCRQAAKMPALCDHDTKMPKKNEELTVIGQHC